MGYFRPWLKAVLITFGALLLASLLAGLIWPLPTLLTDRPNDGLTAAERLKATNDVRVTLVSAMVGTLALGSIVTGLRTYRLSQHGQFTDRYSRAVEQVASEKVTVRLGGIYALERLAKKQIE